MTRLAGVMYICNVCGKEFFCEEDNTSGFFIGDIHHGKTYYKKPPIGWTPELCPDCNDKISRAIQIEKNRIRKDLATYSIEEERKE